MNKLLLMTLVVCSGAAYGMTESTAILLREMFALQKATHAESRKQTALQQIVAGRVLVQHSQKWMCLQCGANELCQFENVDEVGTQKMCNYCYATTKLDDFLPYAQMGLKQISEGMATLKAIEHEERRALDPFSYNEATDQN